MISCLICGGERISPRRWNLKDFAGLSPKSYDFLCCGRCGSLTADPLPANGEIAALYPEHYTYREEPGNGLPGRLFQRLLWWGYPRWTYTHDVNSVLRIVPERPTEAVPSSLPRPSAPAIGIPRRPRWSSLQKCRDAGAARPARLLDVGCGGGIHLRLFRAAGFDVEGIEISPEEAAHVRQTLGCPVHEGPLREAALEPGGYDVVTLFNTLEHLPAPREELKAIGPVLKPAGWIVAKIPVSDGWQPLILGRWWRNAREVPRHLCLPSRRGMRILLEETGFTDVRFRPASLLENACMLGTSLYPWAIPYLNERRFRSGAVRLVNTFIGAVLTYLSLPEALLESLAGGAGTVIVSARKKEVSP